MSQILNLPPRPNPLVKTSKDFLFEKKLGQGAFGQVFQVRLRTIPGLFAVKMVKLIRLNYID